MNMAYDLSLISEMCIEMGFEHIELSDDSLKIKLDVNAILVFENSENDNDSLVGFLETPWHFHGDLMFSDKNGDYFEMNSLDIIEGLRKGTVLICECIVNNELIDRYLVYKDMVDEFRYMESGEEIRVRRII